MFWMAVLGLSFSAMLIKLGVLSATASVMTLVVKALLLIIFAGLVGGFLAWIQRKH
jgi:hypothetical protein